MNIDTGIIDNIIKDSEKNLKLLEIMYSNINGKPYKHIESEIGYTSSIKEMIIKNINLSKKIRTILYGVKNNTHKYMAFDIIVDNINNISLLNLL